MPTVATMPVELVQKLSRMEEQLGQMGKGLRVDEQMLRGLVCKLVSHQLT